ncbi:peroxiredoxin family protein [Saprospiraceae bacterium]|nr:peroxiredoxin family protein [Saprospiraceae bacterium]
MALRDYCTLLIILITCTMATGQNEGIDISDKNIRNTPTGYGIVGQEAPELKITQWVDANGVKSEAVYLDDYKGKFKVLYCFQAWCPGCHSKGLPALQDMTDAMKGNDNIVFLAIQTVFEGSHANTYDRMVEIQKEYDLSIPFGHDPGDDSSRNRSTTMMNYKTGGTPWFIFIDENDKVVFNNFHLDTAKAIAFLEGV